MLAQPKTVGEVDATKSYRREVAILVPLVLVVLGLVAYWIPPPNSVLLGFIVMGSLGGIIHDLVQNKGLVLYPATTNEGVYLGLGLGALLGAVSGFIAFSTIASPTSFDVKSLVTPLTWGLGLKGVIDGATNAVTTQLNAS